MTLPRTDEIDSLAITLKEGCERLVDLLKEQATLKAKLEQAAGEAEGAGAGYFANVFRDMASRLGSMTTENGKPVTPVARRRGRPAKLAEDESSAS